MPTNTVVRGSVLEENREPVLAANIYLKGDLSIVTQSDIDGYFSLSIPEYNEQDTIVISSIGFKTKELPLKDVISRFAEIILDKELYTLNDIVIKSGNPISSFYTISEIDKFDIYMNPLAQGDVLTAVTAIASSISVDETSSPALRGSSGNASIVTLNGVPIHNPSKTNSFNNQGIFRIFNPELIDKEYVYASNPPLIYGNTTAGMVEMETTNKLDNNQIQVGANLTGFNMLLSKRLNDSVHFHVFGNILGSSVLKGIESNSFPEVISFNTYDVGTSFFSKINKSIEFRNYNYINADKYSGTYSIYSYDDSIKYNTKRFLTINNLKLFFKKGVINISQGWEYSVSNLNFGVIDCKETLTSSFVSLYCKVFVNKKLPIQTGIEYRNRRFNFDDMFPYHYYLASPNSPQEVFCETIKKNFLEHYVYASYDITDKIASSVSVRYNFPIDNLLKFFSYQGCIKYTFNPHNNVLIGAGKYHRYNDPSTYYPTFNLVSSSHFSIDYTYKTNSLTVKIAAYYKNSYEDVGKDRIYDFKLANTYTKGMEASIRYSISNHFEMFCSNSFIHQRHKTEVGYIYRGKYDLNYFIKASLTYRHSKIGSLSFAFTTRPGLPTTSITSSYYDDNQKVYIPIWGGYNASIMPCYSRLDFSYNNIVDFKSFKLLYYASIYNTLNNENVMEYYYYPNFSIKDKRLFQKRMFFAGLVFSF